MKTIYKKLLFLLLILPFGVLAQTLEGTVVDAKTKKAIPGVNVIVTQGAQQSTTTDLDGKFKLVKLQNGNVIKFSYIGYKNEMVTYKGQKEVVVSLDEEANTIQEVVVQVGYGSVKKKDATGAVGLITTKDFNKGAITSADGLLNGRVSGVVVTSSGTPGNDPVIRIRGGSSLSASNDPLVVIDGLPMDGLGAMSTINPSDIESFSILKDASATAIYGNRGSNGVIIITTKKGSKGKLQVNFNTFTTLNTLSKEIDVYGADEYRNLIATYVPGKVNLLGNANTDWQKQIFKNSYTSDANLTLLGNLFNKIPARFSLGNTDNNGILLTSRFVRNTASTALNPSFFDNHLKINLNANYSYTYRRSADEGAIGNALSMDPTKPVYDPTRFNGYYDWIVGDTNPSATSNYYNPAGVANPVALLMSKRDISNNNRFYGNINIDYKFHFLPELRAIINAGIDNQEGNGSVTIDPNSRIGYYILPNSTTAVPMGTYSYSWYHNKNHNVNYQLNYTKSIGKWNIDLLAGYEYQQFDWQSYVSGNRNLFGLGTGEEAYEKTYTSPGNKLAAYLGKLNLGYNDKYLLTLNFRRDGSSRISPNNKWANFPGLAIAWKINKESFLNDVKSLSELKVRAGYGISGQQNLPNAYDWFKLYSVSQNNYYQFGNDYVVVASPLGYNENLKWETSTKYNLGVDFGFFNNRIRGSLDFYRANTNNLFSQVAEGALQNLRVYGYRNVGSLKSEGFDFNLNVDVIKHKNFDLNFNYNLSYNNFILTDLFSDNLRTGGVGLGGYVQTLSVGYSPYSFWVYQQVYDANGKPIPGVYVDRNHDGVIDSNDKYIYKKPQAPVTMGFMLNSNFCKHFDFSMAWKASIGNYVYDQVDADRAQLGNINNTVDGTISNAPTDFSNTAFTQTYKESDYYIKNGSFLKLTNITLGYKFLDTFGKKTSLRFYTGIQNVLIITKYRNIDPEVFNNGIDGTIYPRARMYMLGAQVNFN